MTEDRSTDANLTLDANPDIEANPLILSDKGPISQSGESLNKQPVLEDPRMHVLNEVLAGHYWGILKLLYDKKLPADLVIDNKNQWYLTHFAVTHGKPSKLEVLIKIFKADPNKQDAYGQTALHLATTHGRNEELLTLCNDSRIQFEINDALNCTPILNCAKTGFIRALAYLAFEKSVNLNVVDAAGSSIAHWAVMKDDVQMLSLIRKLNGFNWDIVDKEGMNVIQRAIISQSYDCVKYLLGFKDESEEKLAKYQEVVNEHPHIAQILHDKKTGIELSKNGAFSQVLAKPSRENLKDAIRFMKNQCGRKLFMSFVTLFIIGLTFSFYTMNHTNGIGNILKIMYPGSLALFLYFFLSLLYVKTDPGYLPKKTLDDPDNALADYVEKFKNRKNVNDDQYCFDCLNIQPMQTHHCETCKRCVLGYHCHLKNYFGGVCIGYQNFSYFFFMQFFALTFLIIYLMGAMQYNATSAFPISLFERVWLIKSNRNIAEFILAVFIIFAGLQILYNLYVLVAAGSFGMTLHEIMHPTKHKYLFHLVKTMSRTPCYTFEHQIPPIRIANFCNFIKSLCLCKKSEPIIKAAEHSGNIKYVQLEDVKVNNTNTN